MPKTNPTNLEKMLKRALTSERLTSMELKKQKKRKGDLYSFRLQGNGKTEGFSDIRIMQKNGEIFVEDCVKLPQKNRGYEKDIVLLKKAMYEDRGALGNVDNLGYKENRTGHTLSFSVSKDEYKALHHYIDVASEVMGKFFQGPGEIHLAFSLARERIGK